MKNSPEYDRAWRAEHLEQRRAEDIARKRRARRVARGLPEDAPVPKVSEEERKRQQREWARVKYRRARGLPDDAVLRPTLEESRERRLATKRKNEHKRLGSVSREEYRAKLAANRAEKERAAEAAKLAKIRDKLIRDARRAEERASQCRMRKRESSHTVSVKKPGRIVALCGWSGW